MQLIHFVFVFDGAFWGVCLVAVESESKVIEQRAQESADAKVREMKEEVQRYKQEAQQASASLASQLHNRARRGDQNLGAKQDSSDASSYSQAVTPSPISAPQVSAVDQKRTKRGSSNQHTSKTFSMKRTYDAMLSNVEELASISAEKALALCLLGDGDSLGLSKYPFSFIPSSFEKSSGNGKKSEQIRVYHRLLCSLRNLQNDKITISYFIESLMREMVSLASVIAARECQTPNSSILIEDGKELQRPSSSSSSTSSIKKQEKASYFRSTENQAQHVIKRVEVRPMGGINEIEVTSLLILQILKRSLMLSSEAKRCFCHLLSQRFTSSKVSCFKGNASIKSELNLAMIEMMEYTPICNTKECHDSHIDHLSEGEKSALSNNIISAFRTFSLRSFDCKSLKLSRLHLKLQLQFVSLSIMEILVTSKYTLDERLNLVQKFGQIFFPCRNGNDIEIQKTINRDACFEPCLDNDQADIVTILERSFSSRLPSETSSVLLSVMASLSKSSHFMKILLNNAGERLFNLFVDEVESLTRIYIVENSFDDKQPSVIGKGMKQSIGIIRFIRILCESEAGVVHLMKERSPQSSKLADHKRKRSGISVLSEFLFQVASEMVEENQTPFSNHNSNRWVASQLLRELVMVFSIIMQYMPSASDKDKDRSILAGHKPIVCSALNKIMLAPSSTLIDHATRYESRILMGEIDEIFLS